MPSTKEIRRRIKSIKSTRQITKAMEMVSAAKMRKAQMQTLATRAYASYAWQLIQNLSRQGGPSLHRLLRRPAKSQKALIILLTSNRGLIGGFNTNVTQAAIDYSKKYQTPDFITMGKKGRDVIRKLGFSIIADFEKRDASSGVIDIQALAKLAVGDFVSGKYDRVAIIYMKFISTLVQKPTVVELLPLSPLPNTPPSSSAKATADRQGEGNTEVGSSPLLGEDKGLPAIDLEPSGDWQAGGGEYLFEPTVGQVLEEVLPKLTVMQIYQALLETNAAEHSARMVAMKNASESAADLVSELTLEFNQIRQGNITKEISEIVSGKLALNQD